MPSFELLMRYDRFGEILPSNISKSDLLKQSLNLECLNSNDKNYKADYLDVLEISNGRTTAMDRVLGLMEWYGSRLLKLVFFRKNN